MAGDKTNHDELLFVDEQVQDEVVARPPWKMLIVDDDEEVHSVTKLVTGDFTFEGRNISHLSAYSAQQGKVMMREHPDVAVILLDVVMESTTAGLELARFIREELCNPFVRIILRTGQPGQAPEQEVIAAFDINDYRHKAELTAQKLFSSVITAIRSYRDLRTVEETRQGMNLLAVSVSHQIRNRVMSIGGFANLMRRKPDLPEGDKAKLDAIVEEAGRLEDLVRAVKDYSTIPRIRRVRVDLDGLLDEARGIMDDEAKSAGRSIAWSFESSGVEAALAPKIFLRALMEVLRNAFDFQQGESVPIEIRVFASDISLSVVVRDKGPGIDSDQLSHIFDPFYTQKPDGVGMGLTVARRIIAEHQGELVVENRTSGGIQATISIPRSRFHGLAED